MTQATSWNEDVFEEILNAPGGLVANFIWELSLEAAAVAIATVHVLPGTPRSGYWTPKSTAIRPSGYTRARIRPHLAWGARTGKVYGGVNSPYAPSTWLETPAEQYKREYPFLTTGLWSLEGTF